MKTNKFSLSHYKMLSTKMGLLIPIQTVPVIPGDIMQGQNSILARMAPLNTPVYHQVTIRCDSWFVPYRVVFPEWEDFITGDDSITLPTVNPVSYGLDNLHKYFDIAKDQTDPVLAFSYYIYNLIFRQRYMDQETNVLPPQPGSQLVQRISWEKDRYTTQRPEPAKGGDVVVPVQIPNVTGNNLVFKSGSSDTGGRYANEATATYVRTSDTTATEPNVGININDLREAAAMQRYQEARIRYGSRFTEYLRYLGITPSDARLQEPELLGSGRGQMNFSEVLQTAPNDTGDGVGDLFGHGIAGVRTRPWRRFFEEHGQVMTLLSIRPKAVYTEVTQREHLKRSKEDWYQKELVHLGQQPLWNGELFPNGGTDPMGWEDRYNEYRSHPSSVAGEFTDVLNTWHMSREYDTQPVLNQSWTDCNPSTRIFQDQTSDNSLLMINNSLVARRMIPRTPRPKVM